MAQLMRTSNPALSGDTFRTGEATFGESMTVSGTVNKTGLLLILCVVSAAWTWNRFFAAAAASPEEAMQSIALPVMAGGIGGFIVAMVTIFKKQWAGDYRAHLRAAGRPGAGRRLRPAGAAFSRHRHPGGGANVWHADRDAAGLPLRPDQGHRQVAARHCGRHRRHCGLLLPAIHPGILRRALQLDQWRDAASASASAWWSWSSPR